jgi:hypothetical protein
MLPDTITVNSGSPAGDKVFSGIQRDGNTVTYAKDSPQGDLLGAWGLRFAAETTKAGIVRSLESVRRPYYNSTTGKYEGECVVNITITRPASLPVAFAHETLEIASEVSLQTAVKDALILARH